MKAESRENGVDKSSGNGEFIVATPRDDDSDAW